MFESWVGRLFCSIVAFFFETSGLGLSSIYISATSMSKEPGGRTSVLYLRLGQFQVTDKLPVSRKSRRPLQRLV
ncbi:hypothetical protein EDD18DRAFT_1142031 [Armillaria luteobubalina]|uniref:Uncharacterized protein n=1 Tax=Armillaria luteobubalina TaxID=153913 RepID=A0AA39USJ9_9AGAR|nr:hypothetical protein EDD18DRAFT_1142031 [Armillaria luteobubalina]